MRASDLARSALQNLLGDRKRTGLCLLGVAIGVAAVVLLSGIGNGARLYLRHQFELIGSDVVGVLPGKVETQGGMPGLGGGVPNDLTIADAQALVRGANGVLRAAPIAMGTETASTGERSRQVVVVGTTSEQREMRDLSMRAGSFLPVASWERGSRVAVLGLSLARELFPGRSPLGQVLRIGDWRMRVIGVLKSQGMRFGMNMDETIFIPVATSLAMFDKSSLFQITVQARPGVSIEKLVDDCRTVLVDRHGEEDFTVSTPDAILGSLDSILEMLTLGLAGIASISLLVAGIGIMNVMLVSVAERTPEIGLCKAVGAGPRHAMS